MLVFTLEFVMNKT